MCQAIPGKVLELIPQSEPKSALVDFNGLKRQICMDCVPQAVPGDYVIVHAGFAISCMDEGEARETLALFRQMEEGSP